MRVCLGGGIRKDIRRAKKAGDDLEYKINSVKAKARLEEKIGLNSYSVSQLKRIIRDVDSADRFLDAIESLHYNKANIKLFSKLKGLVRKIKSLTGIEPFKRDEKIIPYDLKRHYDDYNKAYYWNWGDNSKKELNADLLWVKRIYKDISED